jgi:alpha-beta hydrolase superfamily lysophospholipase
VAARLADLWPTFPTGRGNGYMTARARAELVWARRAVLADAQRIERPLLFVLGGADRVTDTEVTRRFAGDLGSRATVEWFPTLAYDLVAHAEVRAPLLRFIAGYRSFDPAPKNG